MSVQHQEGMWQALGGWVMPFLKGKKLENKKMQC
jgi:hypothetical protein